MKSKNLENFQKLVSDEKSYWMAKFEYYKTNKKWLDKSAKVAITVLEALREKGWSQKDLSEKMNVSAQQINKIVRGKQNLTFETVGKLETALEISLIEIIEYKAINEIKTNAIVLLAAKLSISEEIHLKTNEYQLFSDNFKKKESTEMNVVYKNVNEPLNYKFTG